MAIVLYNKNGHVCPMFTHLSDEGGEAVQANPSPVIEGQQGAIIGRHFQPSKLTQILQTRQDGQSHRGHSRPRHAHSAGAQRNRGVARALHALGGRRPVLGPGEPHPVFGRPGRVARHIGRSGPTHPSLARHLPRMEAFHRPDMVSQKVLRLWTHTARQLPIEMIVPRHGAPLVGDALPEFLSWIGDRSCGVDHLTQANYTVPQ